MRAWASESAFWGFVWLAGVRLPFKLFDLPTAIVMSGWGCWSLIAARYLGIAAKPWYPGSEAKP